MTAPTVKDWAAQGQYMKSDSGRAIWHRSVGDGPDILVLHGFPSWSYEYSAILPSLEADYRTITFDFLGFGLSDKPRYHVYSIAEGARFAEAVVKAHGAKRVHVVAHDYGAIVAQELLDRHRLGRLAFEIASVTFANAAVFYEAYRPTKLQRIVSKPVVGTIVNRLLTPQRYRSGLDEVRVEAVTNDDFERWWTGLSRQDGHRLARRLLRYNAERDIHHERWENAVIRYEGPIALIWGLADPVSGPAVLDIVRKRLPQAEIRGLDGVGHYPAWEAPERFEEALRAVLS